MKHHSLILTTCAVLLLAQACSPSLAPPSTLSSAPAGSLETVSSHSDIRPGTKGQRLELCTVEGELALPADTNPFMIQSQKGTFGTRMLSWVFGAPALAQPIGIGIITEANLFDEPLEPVDTSVSQAISDEQLHHLKAKVDGKEVKLEILAIRTEKGSADQGGQLKVMSYRLLDVPPTSTNTVIEFISPSGEPVVSGLVPEIKLNQVNRLNARLDLLSTSIVWLAKASKRPLKDFTLTELAELAEDTETLSLQQRLTLEIRRRQDKTQVKAKLTKIHENIEKMGQNLLKRLMNRLKIRGNSNAQARFK